LDAIAEVDKRVAPSEEIDVPPGTSSEQPDPPESRRKGYVPHIIVLLTDGASNAGPPPLIAAQQAAERGVRIYSIGFGTTDAAIIDCWNLFLGDAPSSPGLESQVGGGSSGNGPDHATLKKIAEITGGEFYSATSAAELQLVFQKLHTYMALTNQTIEISVYFAAIGAILAMAALILAFFRHLLF
jgi:Ca-activated chloride channel family protein